MLGACFLRILVVAAAVPVAVPVAACLRLLLVATELLPSVPVAPFLRAASVRCAVAAGIEAQLLPRPSCLCHVPVPVQLPVPAHSPVVVVVVEPSHSPPFLVCGRAVGDDVATGSFSVLV